PTRYTDRSTASYDVDDHHAIPAEADFVAIAQLSPALEADRFLIVKRAIGGAVIDEDEARAVDLQRGVVGRRRAMRDLDVHALAGLGAADRVLPLPKRPELAERVVL